MVAAPVVVVGVELAPSAAGSPVDLPHRLSSLGLVRPLLSPVRSGARESRLGLPLPREDAFLCPISSLPCTKDGRGADDDDDDDDDDEAKN